MQKPFPRLSYADSMDRFGSDKPDLRFGMEIKDLSDIVAEYPIRCLSEQHWPAAVRSRAFAPPAAPATPAASLDELNETGQDARRQGAW